MAVVGLRAPEWLAGLAFGGCAVEREITDLAQAERLQRTARKPTAPPFENDTPGARDPGPDIQEIGDRELQSRPRCSAARMIGKRARQGSLVHERLPCWERILFVQRRGVNQPDVSDDLS